MLQFCRSHGGSILPRRHGSCCSTGLFLDHRHVLPTKGAATPVSREACLLHLISTYLPQKLFSHGIWFAGNCVANLVGGLLGYGIGHIHSPIGEWRVLFLILGCVTTAYSVVLLFLLPDSPAKARFLNTEEKKLALHRILENKTGVMDENMFKPAQMVAAFRDPQAWLLCLYTISINIPNGGITSVRRIPLIIHFFLKADTSSSRSLVCQLDYWRLRLRSSQISPLPDAHRGMPIGCPRLRISRGIARSKHAPCPHDFRLDHLADRNAPGQLPGSIQYVRTPGWNLAWCRLCRQHPYFPQPHRIERGRFHQKGHCRRHAVHLLQFGKYRRTSILFNVAKANLPGKRAFLAALLVDAKNTCGQTGIRAVVSGFSFAIFFLLLLLAYYAMENRRRDRLYGPVSQITVQEDIAESISNKTDRENDQFRYVM